MPGQLARSSSLPVESVQITGSVSAFSPLAASAFFFSHALTQLQLDFFFCFTQVPKGGWESTDVALEAAALREALEEGRILCPSHVPPHPDIAPRILVPTVVPFPYSWCAWHNHAFRDNHPDCRVDVPLLRARRRKSRLGLVRKQRKTPRVGRLCGSYATRRLETRTDARPRAFVPSAASVMTNLTE